MTDCIFYTNALDAFIAIYFLIYQKLYIYKVTFQTVHKFTKHRS